MTLIQPTARAAIDEIIQRYSFARDPITLNWRPSWLVCCQIHKDGGETGDRIIVYYRDGNMPNDHDQLVCRAIAGSHDIEFSPMLHVSPQEVADMAIEDMAKYLANNGDD